MCKGLWTLYRYGLVTGAKIPERDPMLFVNCFEPSWVNLGPICKTTSTGGKGKASWL